MKTMYAGFVAAILVAIAAWAVLNELGFSSAEIHSSENVRLE